MKKIAVVILNWNGAKLLEQFLPSVIRFSDEAKIYVADNASTDNS
ncbi:MAG TPA: glycosyltransferase family 2 protein, partial [Flavobacterium sp.]|nr:glycosyltransferase family 2 protein [Flavobacterium sp.]